MSTYRGLDQSLRGPFLFLGATLDKKAVADIMLFVHGCLFGLLFDQ
ncbi:hypothetical protein [Brevibacillus reuszeri]|nr:hypothetical protein [Brevibacillus reuszeri]